MSLPATQDALIKAMQAAVARKPVTNTAGADYLKLHKNGYWVMGADEIDVEDKSQWAVNPNSFAMGYIAWGNGTPVGEEMALITDSPVLEANLPDVGAQWNQQVGFEMVCVSGEDKGKTVIYKANSKGGLTAFQNLLNDVLHAMEKNPEEAVAIVELLVDSYKHKKYGQINTPIFKIHKFVAMDADAFGSAEEVEDEPEVVEEEPRRRRRRA